MKFIFIRTFKNSITVILFNFSKKFDLNVETSWKIYQSDVWTAKLISWEKFDLQNYYVSDERKLFIEKKLNEKSQMKRI